MRALALAAALCAAGCARSDAEWIAALDDPDPFERALAAIAICEQAPERAASALPVLLESIDRVELELGARCNAALARVAPAVADEIFVELLETELPSAERRAALERALAAAGPRAVASALALVAGPAGARGDEIGALLLAIGAPCVPALTAALVSEQEPVARAFAAWVLGRIGAPAASALPALASLRGDPDAGVRDTASEAIARIEAARRGTPGPVPGGG